MVGLAMIILTVIFAGAAFYRKKFMEMLIDSLTMKAGKTQQFDPSKIMRTARNMGLTYMAYKRWGAKGSGSGKSKEDYSRVKPHPDDNKHVDSGRFPEHLDPEEDYDQNPYEGENPNYDNLQIVDGKEIEPEFTSYYYDDDYKSGAWEGQPPEGWPFKSLSGSNNNTVIDNNKSYDNNDFSIEPESYDTVENIESDAVKRNNTNTETVVISKKGTNRTVKNKDGNMNVVKKFTPTSSAEPTKTGIRKQNITLKRDGIITRQVERSQDQQIMKVNELPHAEEYERDQQDTERYLETHQIERFSLENQQPLEMEKTS